MEAYIRAWIEWEKHITHWIYARPLGRIGAAIAGSVLLWAGLAFLFTRNPRLSRFWKYLNLLLLIAEVVAVLYITVFSRAVGERELIWIPFYSFYEAKIQPELYRAMLMNVLLFVPYGLTMPFAGMRRPEERLSRSRRSASRAVGTLWRRHGIRSTLLSGLALSCAIEVLQYYFRLGRAEVDDVLCNVLGAAVGCLAYGICRRLDGVTMKREESKR